MSDYECEKKLFDIRELDKAKGGFENIQKSYDVLKIAWCQADYKYNAWRLLSNNKNNGGRIFNGVSSGPCQIGYNLITLCVINDLFICLIKLYEEDKFEYPNRDERSGMVRTLSLFYIFNFILKKDILDEIKKMNHGNVLFEEDIFNKSVEKLTIIRSILADTRFREIVNRNRRFRNKVIGHYDINSILNDGELEKPLYDDMKYLHKVASWSVEWITNLFYGNLNYSKLLMNNKTDKLSILCFCSGIRKPTKDEISYFRTQLDAGCDMEDICFDQ